MKILRISTNFFVFIFLCIHLCNASNQRKLQETLDEEEVVHHQDMITEIHFRPDHRPQENNPINRIADIISDTFLVSPSWAEDALFNESDYASFYNKVDSMLKPMPIDEYKELMDQHDSDDQETKNELMEKAMKRKRGPKKVRVFCYAFSIVEVTERCAKALDWGSGVYIQLNDAVTGQKYKDNGWYEAINTLQKDTNLEIYGIYFGGGSDDNYWKILEEIFEEINKIHLKIHGILVGLEAKKSKKKPWCLNDFTNDEKLKTILKRYNHLEISYLTIEEENCYHDPNNPPLLPSYESDLHVNYYTDGSIGRKIPIPADVQPLFPCYDGHEGKCYQAFTRYTQIACDPVKQRYVFAPYSAASNRLLHLLNEMCLGIGIELPSHDVVRSV